MENSSHFQINDYLKPGRHAHLVGIGGVSMRPLGLVLRSMGMEITGSDMNSSVSTQELIDRSIAELLSARGLDVASLGQSDRVDVIRHLNGNGVFMLKGAVACAATALGISEPSVYRYLQKVRKEG